MSFKSVLTENSNPYKDRDNAYKIKEEFYNVADGIVSIDDLIKELDPKKDKKNIEILKKIRKEFEKVDIGKYL